VVPSIALRAVRKARFGRAVRASIARRGGDRTGHARGEAPLARDRGLPRGSAGFCGEAKANLDREIALVASVRAGTPSICSFPDGPCWARTSDLGINSPSPLQARSCKKRQMPAPGRFRLCNDLHRTAVVGDEAVRADVRAPHGGAPALRPLQLVRRPRRIRHGGGAARPLRNGVPRARPRSQA